MSIDSKYDVKTSPACLDGGFRRKREGKVYFLFLNYEHYEMFFKKLTY